MNNEEILRLADRLSGVMYASDDTAKAAAELRRMSALNAELAEALQWYVDTDDVMDMDGNEFWLQGRDRARAVLAKVEASK